MSSEMDINIEKSYDIILPPQTVVDQVVRFFSMLNKNNIHGTGNMLKKYINQSYLPWLANYLVTKQVDVDLEFHQTCADLLNYLNSDILNSYVLSETRFIICNLLKSNDRSENAKFMLKNMGQWLVVITVAKGRPLPKHIDLKTILVEAIQKSPNEFEFIFPFVINVLQTCAKSHIFCNDHPWMLSILYCLAINKQSNSQSDVTDLCKAFNIDIENLLSNYGRTTTGMPLELDLNKPYQIISPSTAVENKIEQIFNNLTKSYIRNTSIELKKLINKYYLPWLANYLVTRRVSVDTNLHTLYADLLDCLNSDFLNSLVMSETQLTINKLLKNSDRTEKSKMLLKYMGLWLSSITLAKEKPIPENIDLKKILIEANLKGPDEIAFILPFIMDMLQACVKSTIYGPNSPWTSSILQSFVETLRKHNSKLSLTIEEKKVTIALCHLTKNHKQSNMKSNCDVENRSKTLSIGSKNSISNHSSQTTVKSANSISNNSFQVVQPSPNVKGQIERAFDMLTINNLHIVKNECLKLISRYEFPWLANYLVTRRVSMDIDIQPLCADLLDSLNSDSLHSFVLSETQLIIYTLLNNNNRSLRSKNMLHNLGLWLGNITIAKTKPLPDKMDLKMLMVEANHISSDEFAFILPFVINVLQACKKNSIYGSAYPSILSALCYLIETRKRQHLKLPWVDKLLSDLKLI